MSRITLYGVKKDRKAILEYLQRCGIMDITTPESDNTEYGFSNMNTAEPQSEFTRSAAAGERALEILDQYAPEKCGMFSGLGGRRVLSAEEYYSYTDDIPEMQRVADRIAELSEEIAKRQGDIVRYRASIDELEPWRSLDAPFECGITAGCRCLVGTFPEQLTAEEILRRYYAHDGAPPVYAEVISSAPQQTCVFVIADRNDPDKCESMLRDDGFARPKTSYSGVPSDEIAQRERMIRSLQSEITARRREIESYRGARSALRFMSDYFSMRSEKYEALGKLDQRKRTFVITGYVPTDAAAGLAARLEHEYNAAVEIEDSGDDAPVLLKNSRLTEPVESVVETFAMPARGEIDPTSIMAFFYYIFFGLMLSDAAYGLIMTVGCAAAIHHFKGMETGLKKTLRMFMYCGISTMFWGVLFGSYFGDIVQVVSGTFFGHEITIEPLWFEPVKDPMRMLMFSFLLGLIHLFTGLGIKLYQCIKAKDIMGALTDCIFWYMLVGGGVVYLFHVDMFLTMAGLSVKLPTVWANIAACTAAAGALGILLFTSRGGGVGKRLAKGAYALYGATSWLSDILSYSRLLALGLATGVIATVFNKMGSMLGGGMIGAAVFIPVFLAGHALNIGVNLLGAYVHTNRLQFVEFFGKFYEGGGRAFKPFSAHTKYYKFKEEILK